MSLLVTASAGWGPTLRLMCLIVTLNTVPASVVLGLIKLAEYIW
jgi:hypothetical protein